MKNSIKLALFVGVLLVVGIISVLSKKSSKEGEIKKTEPIQITFWHSMSGNLGDSLNKMVDDFNKSQTNIIVTAQYQGSYDDSINKLKSSMLGNQGPDLVQIYDIGTRFMIDSGYALPMQNFIDEDKNFNSKVLEPNLLAYYTVDNKLYSMPFNSSNPILYYNKTALKEAGLNENDIPKNFEDLESIAGKLTKKDANGNTTQYGYSMAIYGWFFEQFLVNQNKNYANNENGRKSATTSVEFDKNGGGKAILDGWKKLVDSGSIGNFGRKTSDTQNAFVSGNTAMIIDSTASLKSILNGVNGKFEVGTAFLPSVNKNDKGGVSIGGASLWVINNNNSEKQKAVWEFTKFLISAKSQSFWNSNTGYFPVTTEAYNLPETKEFLKNQPQFLTAIEQLHNSSTNSVGALLGVFPSARATIEANIEDMLSGKISSEEALKKSADSINESIKKYNDSL
ncbi:MAG: ABC transporter substrate-binding protein [Fusobacteriaceae bacterium]|nr:ABC transporter substrate-binding protein [Fusobacteriaceae bacterium]